MRKPKGPVTSMGAIFCWVTWRKGAAAKAGVATTINGEVWRIVDQDGYTSPDGRIWDYTLLPECGSFNHGNAAPVHLSFNP